MKSRSIPVAAPAILALFAAAVSSYAQARTIADDRGVTVNFDGLQLMHRSPVRYPADAAAKGLKGKVAIQVTLDANGEVMAAAVLNGPDELGTSARQSVLTWHFDKRAGVSPGVVNINFIKPENPVVPLVGQSPDSLPARTTTEVGVSDAPPQPPAPQSGIIDQIDVTGLPDSIAAELLAGFPVHAGDLLTRETLIHATDAALQFDSHLMVEVSRGMLSDNVMKIRPRERLEVDADVSGIQVALLVKAERPIYPPLAKMARQHGLVQFEATVGKDGSTEDLKLIKGPPLLVPIAREALGKWVYQPTMLAGAAVEIVRTIDVNFDLMSDSDSKDAPAAPRAIRGAATQEPGSSAAPVPEEHRYRS